MIKPSFSIGIEEEYQIIDPRTRELKSYITQFLEEGKVMLRESIKAEMHQSMVEVGTEICHTPSEVRAELVRRGLPRAATFSWPRCAEHTIAVYRAVHADATGA